MLQPFRSLLFWAPSTPLPETWEADAIICEPTQALPSFRNLIVVVRDNGESALRSAIQLRPAGVILPDCRSGADVQKLHVLLSVAEAEEGVPVGQTRILASTDGLLPLPFSPADFRHKSERLIGLVWDWRALEIAIRATRSRHPDGRWTETFAQARSATLIAAKAAGIAAYELVQTSPQLDLTEACRDARADGFDGTATLSATDIATINQAFEQRD